MISSFPPTCQFGRGKPHGGQTFLVRSDSSRSHHTSGHQASTGTCSSAGLAPATRVSAVAISKENSNSSGTTPVWYLSAAELDRVNTALCLTYAYRNFSRKVRKEGRSQSYEKDFPIVGAYCPLASMPRCSLGQRPREGHESWRRQNSRFADSFELHYKCGVPFRSALRLYIWL
jgi:hypothetical protein